MSTGTMNGFDSRPQRNGGRSEWQGYELQVPLDEIFECDKCSPGCRKCYYKCRSLPSACKVVMIITLLTSTVLLTALIIRFVSFGPGSYLVGNGDQIHISDKSSQNEDNGYSRFFCSDFTLTSTSTPPQEFSSYVVMTKSTRSSDRWKYNLEDNILISYGTYFYSVHTFYQSDSLSLIGCVPTYEVNAILYVIHGEKNYKAWQSQSCTSCYRREVFKPCSYHEDNKVHLTFTSTDIVYFAYTLEYGFPSKANLSLEFIFDRTRYVKKDIVDSCVNTTSCKLEIPLHTADILIEQGLYLNENINKIRTECKARISIYFAFFLGVPVAISLVFTCLGLILKKCQDDLIRDLERADRIREYNRFGVRRSTTSRPPPSTSTGETVSSTTPRFSSSSLSANRSLSVSATVPLIQNEQAVGSLPPDYRSINQIQTNEPPPPTYNDVARVTATDGQSYQEPPPPAYDDVSALT